MKEVVMVTENGEAHGLVNSIPNSVKNHDYPEMDPKYRTELEKKRKEDSKMVKARYINYKGLNERLDKPYMLYPGDPIRFYHLIPGHTYDLPYGFVREVNDSKGLAKRGQQVVGKQYVEKDMGYEKTHELVPITF